MKIISIDCTAVTVTLSADEILFVHQALNEVINGLDIQEFETRTGFTLEQARLLMSQIAEIIDSVAK